jgi:gliding motility-associated-like protein
LKNSKVYILFLLVTSVTNGLLAQEIERQVVGSSSNESTNGNITISATIGEPAVLTKTDGNLVITEGFQQPQLVTIVIGSDTLHFYSGITPNNDGSNDQWEIEGIEGYPESEINIFGRSGNEVWSGNNYDNETVVFNGIDAAGNPLPSGTYFYVMSILGDSESPRKGWIQVTW